MLKTRVNTSGNDWTFGNASTNFYIDNELAVAQDLKTSLQEWKYDWFADLETGIDWKTRLGNKNQRQLLDEDIQNLVTSKDYILTLNNFQSFVSGRNYTAQFSVTHIFSQNPLTIEFEM
jgi:hypothetical protein